MGFVQEVHRFFNNPFLVAMSTLMSTIVGAGILAIPYVVSQAGFVYGLLLMFFLGIAFVFLNLFIGEVVLRTKEQFQLPGYAGKYLGKWGKALMAFSMVVAIYGALTAYLIGQAASLEHIFGFPRILIKLLSIFPAAFAGYLQAHIYALFFFIVGVSIVLKGVKSMGKTQLALIPLLIAIIFAIGIFSYDKITLQNLSGFNPVHLFLPYGVILFAYMASPAVPEMQEMLGKNRTKMKKAIIIASSIPIILYIFFTFVIVGIVGTENFSLLQPNQRIATIALGIYANPLLGLFAHVLAIISMFTSFLALGVALVELYNYDYKLSIFKSYVLAFSVPLVCVLLDLTSFVAVIGITGAVAGGFEGVLIVLMYWKAKRSSERTPEYSLRHYKLISIILAAMFALGILHQIWANFF